MELVSNLKREIESLMQISTLKAFQLLYVVVSYFTLVCVNFGISKSIDCCRPSTKQRSKHFNCYIPCPLPGLGPSSSDLSIFTDVSGKSVVLSSMVSSSGIALP